MTLNLIRRPGQSSIVTAMALMMASCATLPDEPATKARFLEGGPSETEKERMLLASRPDLGLALSGGGLRSALYSLGVVRALHEKGVLEKVDVISTVSGGSYIGYWLYTGQGSVDSSHPFGFARLNDKAFGRALCEMKANGNFVPHPLMARSVLTGGAAGTVRMYIRRIQDVYGDLDTSGMKFSEIADLVGKRYPYLIVGATVQKPKPNGWHDAVYEFTAAGTRWGPRGEKQWTNGSDITYAKAVAISGAAFGPALKQTIPEPTRPNGAITLYDGGKSENLGALALIRRAVKKIIIVDAEHDPKYNFGAYVNLRTRLKAWNAGIQIPEIDDFLEPPKGEERRKGRESPAQSYFQGEAWGLRSNGTKFKCDIHYFKMSMPQALRDRLANSKTPPPAFTEFNKEMEDAFDRDKREYDCEKLAYKLPLIPFFEHAVFRYTPWNRTLRARLPLNNAALNFPQYTTYDQSMYGDQAAAFIGLGYLQGRQYPQASQPKVKER